MLEKKLHEELMRYKAINRYADKLVMEQEVPPAPDAALPADVPAADPALDAAAAPTDVPPADTATEPLTDQTTDSTEEIDITDLVNMTKSIKQDIESNKNEHGQVLGQMNDIFTKLDDLESKLSQMDSVISKIDELGSKVESMKEPTPQEKLEMRSLDSYPFNQNPQQFFAAKQGEMKQSGKNEYVLTKDEVENYSNDIMRTSFNPQQQQDEFKF